MRVLLNCLSSVSGGGVAYLRNISKLLATEFLKSGTHELIFLAHADQAALLQGVDPAQIILISGPRPDGLRRVLWERLNLPRYVREKKVDVLYTPYQVAPLVRNARNVLMIRNMEPFLFGGYPYSFGTRLRNEVLSRISSRCLREADRVIAVSQFASDHLTKHLGIPASRARTVYHGSPPVRSVAASCHVSAELSRIGVKGKYILTCGSMLPYRRCEDVIGGFNECVSSLPEGMRLVIAGSGADSRYAETIRQAIASSPTPERIMTLGHVPWTIMMGLYQNCTACVIATEIEACPNIALEAMAAGCVIVSSDRPPLPEMFQGCVLEYKTRNIEHLAMQMLRAVEDSALRSDLKAHALQRSNAFSWQSSAQRTYSALVDW